MELHNSALKANREIWMIFKYDVYAMGLLPLHLSRFCILKELSTQKINKKKQQHRN